MNQAFCPSITGTGPTNQINTVEALDGAQLTLLGYAPYLLAVLVGVLAYQFNRCRMLLASLGAAAFFSFVQRDLQAFFRRLVPEGDPLWTHTAEGPDDMPAHVRAALTQTSLSIPVVGGRLALGTWQGVYLWEHRRRGSQRQVLVHVR